LFRWRNNTALLTGIALVLFCLFLTLYVVQFERFDQRSYFDHDYHYTNTGLTLAYWADEYFLTAGAVMAFFDPERPQLVNLYLASVLSVFGNNDLVYRLANLPFAFLLIFGVYLLGREIRGRETGIVAAWIGATAPVFFLLIHKWFFHFHTFGLCVIGIGLALRIYRKGEESSDSLWVGLGAVFAIAALIHPIALVYAAVAFAIAGFQRPFQGLNLAIAGIVLVVITAPWYLPRFLGYAGLFAPYLQWAGYPNPAVDPNLSVMTSLFTCYEPRVQEPVLRQTFPLIAWFLASSAYFVFRAVRNGLSDRGRVELRLLLATLVLAGVGIVLSWCHPNFFRNWSAVYLLGAAFAASVTVRIAENSSKKAIVWVVIIVLSLANLQVMRVAFSDPAPGLIRGAAGLESEDDERVLGEVSAARIQLEPDACALVAEAIGSGFEPGTTLRMKYQRLLRQGAQWKWLSDTLNPPASFPCGTNTLFAPLVFEGTLIEEAAPVWPIGVRRPQVAQVMIVYVENDESADDMREALTAVRERYPDYRILRWIPNGELVETGESNLARSFVVLKKMGAVTIGPKARNQQW
jgi:4-amino-4-deoxy-L-arabinose transferase-like glycosyltransferase